MVLLFLAFALLVGLATSYEVSLLVDSYFKGRDEGKLGEMNPGKLAGLALDAYMAGFNSRSKQLIHV